MTSLRIPVGVMLLAAIGFFLSGCKAGEPNAVAGPDAVVVRIADVTRGQAQEASLRFSGIVQSTQRASLTFQISGILTERSVELGQAVAAGDVLARIYAPALEPARDSASARLDELTSNYQQAQREWQRAQNLHQRSVISEQALEQIAARRDGLKASVATARAALAEASRMLAENTLKAPFAGRVEALLVQQDEFVAAGQPVMRLSAAMRREVEVRLPAYLLNHVSLGDSLAVWRVQDRSLSPVQGTVVEIAQAGAIRGELQPVLVSLPANTLKAGVSVEVGITRPTTGALTVPLLSVIRDANSGAVDGKNGTSVFRVRDGIATRVPVVVLRVLGERVAIQSGELKPGDKVVYAGMTRLVDGDAVVDAGSLVRHQSAKG